LREAFGIADADLIGGSYCDLLLELPFVQSLLSSDTTRCIVML
jgi:hypothetical protein